MKVAYSPIYRYQRLPDGHRFPMDKYDLLPQQLLHDGTLTESNFFHPQPLEEEQILRTHTQEYWEKLKFGTLSRHEIRAMGFPYHESLIFRGRHIANGTLQCVDYAMQDGVALNIAGGTHHAFADRGEGFCIFNDFAIASNELLYQDRVNQIMIIDLDVHQGNGTAKIFENNPNVFTLSVHGEHNYPLKKENSDIDIGVPDGIEDKDYLAVLHQHIPDLIDQIKPDVIFYLSGVDVLKSDKLGRLALSKEGCRERDRFVFEACKKRGIPVVVSMGGGYSPQISDIIDAHANTFRLAYDLYF
ncbi:MAG: histone deacetylase [Flavobacteriales bacterium]|jgi:acetoin utilization deacetylase AcuC-like enzyme|nr:histone deacetylase [Flavobacteriales bacterium]